MYENQQRATTPKVCLELWFLCTALLLNELWFMFTALLFNKIYLLIKLQVSSLNTF